MEPAKRFFEYATDFEKTYADDDWTRLEPHFTEDAVYAIDGESPFGGRHEGRAQLIDYLRNSVNEFDRKFDTRRVEPVGEPKSGSDWFEMRWRGTYEKAGCPDLVLEGVERATFRGDRIALLEDAIEREQVRKVNAYLERHFS